MVNNKQLSDLYRESDSNKPLSELFHVRCKKCGSEDVIMQDEEDVNPGGGGCPTCGYGGEGSWKFYLGLKCLGCGNAKIIFKEDDY